MSKTGTLEAPSVTDQVSSKGKPSQRKAGPHKPPAKSNETEQRLSEHGLVRIDNRDELDKVPLYYYTDRNKWYAPNGPESFGYFPEGTAKSLLAEYGFNRKVADAQGNTPADRATIWLMQNHSVCYAGPLAGYRAGLHRVQGTRILVTETPRFIEPKPGNWSVIRMLIESLLADDTHNQKDIFYLWLAESFRAFHERMSVPGPWPFRHCPALAIFGPRLCGKTALIELVIAPLFGGRKGDPMTFMSEKRFNKELFGASLLVLDDKGTSSSLVDRRERGESLKDLIWKQDQRMEGKGADAINLRPFWRLVIAGNDDDSGLQVCPALSPSLEDKLIILRAQPATGLPETHEECDEWAQAISKALPAFAAFLLGYQPPSEMHRDHRTQVANFWHPAIVMPLRDMQPEMKLLELVDSLDLVGAEPFWQGTATDFERELRSKDKEHVTERLFVSQQAAGRMLSELVRLLPDRIQRTIRGGSHWYRLMRKRDAGEVTQENGHATDLPKTTHHHPLPPP